MTLKAIRINNGWTVEETAKKYGVSVDTIRNYENFKTFPDVPVINNIIRATKLQYNDIIFLPKENAKSVKELNQKETS